MSSNPHAKTIFIKGNIRKVAFARPPFARSVKYFDTPMAVYRIVNPLVVGSHTQPRMQRTALRYLNLLPRIQH